MAAISSVVALVCVLTLARALALGADVDSNIERRISIEWRDQPTAGSITVSNGALVRMSIVQGKGAVQGNGRFVSTEGQPFRLNVHLKGSARRFGQGSTIVTVAVEKNPFSFFLRDVNRQYPIYIPAYGVVVTTEDDSRSYGDVAEDVQSRRLQTNLQRIDSEPEETYEAAAQNTRRLSCETWLGVSRDIRIFSINPRLESVQPRFHGIEISLPEAKGQPVRYDFLMGRGWGAVEGISRRLEDGVLPILRGRLADEDITYDLTAFVTLESKPLSPHTLRGTHYLVADGHGRGHTFSKEQQQLFESLLKEELNQDEETVLFLRIQATNTAPVPRYAFFRNIVPALTSESHRSYGGADRPDRRIPWSFDVTGRDFLSFSKQFFSN